MRNKRLLGLLALMLSLMIMLPAGAAYPILRPGDSGPQVAQLQQALDAQGYAVKADGKYGLMTQAAVQRFQNQRGLKPDGIAGPQTLGALYGGGAPQPTVAPQPGQTAAPAPQPTRLELGVVGEQVQNLQQKLQDLGYSSGRTDGVFDQGTRNAVTAFQRAQGLKPDGIAGPLTLGALYSTQPLPQPSDAPQPTQPPVFTPAPAPQVPAATSATVFTGNGGVLRMRSEMDSRRNNVITAIPDREPLRVISQQGSWSFVEWRNYQGFVMSSFLKFAAQPTQPPAEGEPTQTPLPSATPQPGNPVPGVTGTAQVHTRNGGSLNFRTSPENLGKANLQGTIPNGQTVVLLAKGAQWCRVQYGSRDGYVMTSFLIISAEPVPTALPGPVETEAPTPAPEPTATPDPTATPEPAQSPTPPPTDGSLFPRILRPGDTGEDVSLLQSRLNKLNYKVLENGMYDDTTFAAVKSFQTINGLSVDGKLGPQTASALMSAAARPADSAPLTYTTLRMGSEDKPGDEAVSRMQQRLKELGYSLSVDGAFGPGTHDAVVSFQRSNGMSQTGVADANTQGRIFGSDAKGPQGGGGVDLSGNKGGGPGEGSVQFLNWYTEVKPKIRGGQLAKVYHPASGVSFNVQYYSLGRHADAEPKTLRDTQVMNAAFGRTSWDVRPVYVQLPDGRWTLATMHNYPHLYGSIRDNGFGGHLCIHFRRELDETQRVDPNYGMQNQRILRQAWKSMTGEVVE